ncbi:MAG: LLM class F420-dependent oxidoreductase [Acidobacteria bacterium]|nr:LLM class F420-dependent oxidoreductase [Acidobacteriota bacterium]
MKVGLVFPQTEIGADPEIIARFATTAEALGFQHLVAYDHVLGASTARRPDWQGPYTSKHMFHEPFVLFSYLAALTMRLELVTGIIILPQRQTALVAKQAACLDVLCKGRLRLGVGIGWNAVEYEALGENFHDRGRRVEEQIDLMRKLWAAEIVRYEGRWHTVTEAGLNPLPPRRAIPVWLGGMAPQVIERAGRLADGWFPFDTPNLERHIAEVRAHARAAGRDPAAIGIEVRVPAGESTDKTRERVERLQALGATHISGVTMNAGLPDPQAHIDAIRRFRDHVAAFM